MRPSSLLLLLLTLCLPNRVLGVVLVDEDFETFPLGSIAEPGWTVASSDISIVSKTMPYDEGIIIGGGSKALRIGPNITATIDKAVDLSFPSITNDEIWFSFLFQSSAMASPPEPDSRDFFQVWFSQDAASHNQSASLVLDNVTAALGSHAFRARVGGAAAGSDGLTDATDAVFNQPEKTYFIVGRLAKTGGNYRTIDLYLNPTTGTAPAEPTSSITWEPTIDQFQSLGHVSWRIGLLEMEDFYLTDRILIGESYADVLGDATVFVQGDFSGNGTIGLEDYTILANNFLSGTTHDEGDFDFNDTVDLADFLLFRDAYAAANPGAAALMTPIPEPSAFCLASIAGLLLIGRRRLYSALNPSR